MKFVVKKPVPGHAPAQQSPAHKQPTIPLILFVARHFSHAEQMTSSRAAARPASSSLHDESLARILLFRVWGLRLAMHLRECSVDGFVRRRRHARKQLPQQLGGLSPHRRRRPQQRQRCMHCARARRLHLRRIAHIDANVQSRFCPPWELSTAPPSGNAGFRV